MRPEPPLTLTQALIGLGAFIAVILGITVLGIGTDGISKMLNKPAHDREMAIKSLERKVHTLESKAAETDKALTFILHHSHFYDGDTPIHGRK